MLILKHYRFKTKTDILKRSLKEKQNSKFL